MKTAMRLMLVAIVLGLALFKEAGELICAIEQT